MSKEERTEIRHPAFGMVEINRVQGRHDNMFGVDYPQGNAIRFKISAACMVRSLSHNRFFPEDAIMEFAMSEVQFAQAITSLNTDGTPCTIIRHRVDGKYTGVEAPPPHMADISTFEKETKRAADDGEKAIQEAFLLVQELRGQPRVSKGDLDRLAEALQKAQREIGPNLEFRVNTAIEAIRDAGERTKQEVTAFAQNQYRLLGRAASVVAIDGEEQNLLPPSSE